MTQTPQLPQPVPPEPPLPAVGALDSFTAGIDGLLEAMRLARGIQTRVEVWMCEAAAALTEHLKGPVFDQHGTVNAAAEEIAMALAITKRSAERYIGVGQAITRHLQVLGEEMHAGTISMEKAWTIVKAIGDTTSYQVAMAVEEVVVPRAAQRTTTELRRDVQRALIEVDPAAADERHTEAVRRRCVTRPRLEPDGMASMRLLLPALDAITIDRALDAAATAAHQRQDPRTLGQVRADTLTDWAAGVLRDGWTTPALPLPDGTTTTSYRVGAVPSAIKVTIPLEVLARAIPGWQSPHAPSEVHGGPLEDLTRAGTSRSVPEVWPPNPVAETRRPTTPSGTEVHDAAPNDADPPRFGAALTPFQHPEPASPEPPGPPKTHEPPGPPETCEPLVGPLPGLPVGLGRLEAAWLEGYGPIAPAVAMLLAAGGEWRRIVTDPLTGAPLDIGRSSYRPPAHIAEAVRQRDLVCARPGCSMPARRCALDHVVEWHEGGETSLANLTPLCNRCHRLKSLGAGREGAPELDGSRVWNSITGKLRTRLAECAPRARSAAAVPPVTLAALIDDNDPPPF